MFQLLIGGSNSTGLDPVFITIQALLDILATVGDTGFDISTQPTTDADSPLEVQDDNTTLQAGSLTAVWVLALAAAVLACYLIKTKGNGKLYPDDHKSDAE